MKSCLAIAAVLCLGACATQAPQGSSAPGLQQVTVDCAHASNMSGELEAIIAEPARTNTTWDSTLDWVGGVRSPQQRLASAKTLLWTIRTQCRGY
jgi:hypothetical protein